MVRPWEDLAVRSEEHASNAIPMGDGQVSAIGITSGSAPSKSTLAAENCQFLQQKHL